MDKKIRVEVKGSYITKDNNYAGVRGEGNSTALNIIFDEAWDVYAKTVTFWNSKGDNPVKITLTTEMLTDISASIRDYTVPIPPEPLEFTGKMTFAIDGYADGVRQRIVETLIVRDAPIADDAGEPSDPTPTQAELLQEEIETIKETIQSAVDSEASSRESARIASEAEAVVVEAEQVAVDAAQRAEQAAAEAEAIAGEGVMLKPTYDTNEDGVVDKADLATTAEDAEKFGGEAPGYYATSEEVEKKEYKGTTSTVVLASASWVDGTYSFETEYPSDEYDIYMELSEESTIEQIEAYANALIVGNSTANVYTAKNGAPAIDIPVIVKVVKK